MKKTAYLFQTMLLLSTTIAGQWVEISGTLRCRHLSENSTRGAESVVVVPGFNPTQAVITQSDPAGYFKINTGMPLKKLGGKQVSIYVISHCMDCRKAVKRFQVESRIINLGSWKLDSSCTNIELSRHLVDSLWQVTKTIEPVNLEKPHEASSLLVSSGFLNTLTDIANVTKIISNIGGTFPAARVDSGRIQYGAFLFSSALYHTANVGFRFSPHRDMSEAVFWNPAAISTSYKANNISLISNYKNNGKLQGYMKLTDRLSIGVGGIFVMQDEFRGVDYTRPNAPGYVDSFRMKLKEYAIVLSPSFAINENLSVAISGKSVHQEFNVPDSLRVLFGPLRNEYVNQNIKKNIFDLDLSICYKIESFLQLGLNIMNVLGSELHGDAFQPRQDTLKYQNLRAIGAGITFKWNRFNLGTDILFANKGLYDVGIGVNFVPFNQGLISAGFTVKQLSYSIAFQMRHFRIVYIDDNDYLVNDKRKGRINLLNGRLYGGFVFDLY